MTLFAINHILPTQMPVNLILQVFSVTHREGFLFFSIQAWFFFVLGNWNAVLLTFIYQSSIDTQKYAQLYEKFKSFLSSKL